MNALAWAALVLWNKVRFEAIQPLEPEPLHGERRPATGLFHSLTLDQQQKIKEYRGPENHGDSTFKLRIT